MSFRNLMFATTTVALVSASALAQPPRGGFGMMNQPLTLVTVPADVLGKELQLTPEIQKKVAGLQQGVQDKMRAAMQELRDGGGFSPEAFQELQKKNQDNSKKAETDILALLNDDQKKAVPDTIKALQMLRTLGLPIALRSELKLTEEQKKSLGELAATVQKERDARTKEIQEAMRNQDMERVRELAQGMRGNGEPSAKALALLTDEQKALVTKYLKDNPQPQGGFRRGGGN